MEWLNLFGLIFVAVILMPNIIFAVKTASRTSIKTNLLK